MDKPDRPVSDEESAATLRASGLVPPHPHPARVVSSKRSSSWAWCPACQAVVAGRVWPGGAIASGNANSKIEMLRDKPPTRLHTGATVKDR
jgi:hypothetical protein